MSDLDFLHGINVVTVNVGPRPIQTARSSVIGIIGTAPDADELVFPLDTPVLINSRGGFSAIGLTGTLPDALDAIYDEAGALVVVIRVDDGANAVEAVGNVIGGTNSTTGVYTGVQAFLEAESALGVTPMLLIAPGFTGDRPTGVATVAVGGSGGTGYTTAPTVAFTGGGGVGATAHAVLGTGGNAGKVVSIVIDNPGRGFTSAPTVALTGGGGTGATATATVAAGPNPVVGALLPLATQLRAHIIAEGPNTTDAAAIAYRADWGSRRIFIVDPAVKRYDATEGAYVVKAVASASVAGLIARIDNEQGFWKSPSNETVNGIGGLGRPIDWSLGNANSRANLLNEAEVATFIREDGWRLWGNRTASDGALKGFEFLCVSRTADMVDLSIMKAHRYAVDRAITKAYFDDVKASVNAYLRQLRTRGAILGGECFVDPDYNQAADITAGHVTFSYDFTPSYPAEHVTFRSTITDAYIPSIFE